MDSTQSVRETRRQRVATIAGAVASALLVACAIGGSARAAKPALDDSPARCKTPDGTAFVDAPLKRLTQRLRANDPLTVVVLGSSSAAGSGTSRREASFPARLEARLDGAFPKRRIRVVTFAEPGQTAQAMQARLAGDVLPLKPALVVLQTGSADAARTIPVTDFANAVEHGVMQLQAANADVILMDSQFSPRASLLVNTDAYREAVRWNARRYDAPLLKRYDTMRYWWSNEVFDLEPERKANQVENADLIHDCIAVLLVRLIERGVATATDR